MATVLANPVEMIVRGAPRVIHNDEELAQYTEVLERLDSLEHPSPEEIDAIELLTLLVTSYEGEHYPIPKATPVEMVRFLMDQHSLKNKDLVPQFGTDSAVSMFLSGQRRLTVPQIQALSARFRLSTDVFIGV
jgi:HTH-type transcriptional regulator / antitoxin HigA